MTKRTKRIPGGALTRRITSVPSAVTTFLVFATVALLVPATPALATYHGTNGLIALSIDRGSGAEIYTIRPNGTGLRRITHVEGDAVFPDWSPDGRRIVFELDVTAPTEHASVEIVNADGSGLTDLTGQRPGGEFTPAFTPDGGRIVFTAQRCIHCVQAIWSMNLEGGDRRRITAAPGYKKRPQVSPDGTSLLFLIEKPLGTVNGLDANVKALYTVNMDGSHLMRIVPFRFDVCACGGDWAPNGSRIEFSDNAGYGAPQTEPTNIATVRPDGTGLRYVTRFSRLDVYASNGSYSPDGRWILFKIVINGSYTLWKIHPDGTQRTRIVSMKFNPTGRDWGSRAD